jgi:hypothetical protein
VFEKQIKKAKYAGLALRAGGIGYITTEVIRRTYRHKTFIGMAKSLDEADNEVKSKIDYSLHLASAEDIEMIPQYLNSEGREYILDLLQRIWFYYSGFHQCYIARTVPGNELCYMQWALCRQDENADSLIFKSLFPRLGEQEMQLEHAYTFKRFRGNKISYAVTNQLFQIARNKGLKRVITYVMADNKSSLKTCQNAGYKQFEILNRTTLPFFARDTIIQATI